MRRFTKSDWDGYQGAEKFSDGSEPMIGGTPNGYVELVADKAGALIYWTDPETGNLGWAKLDFEIEPDDELGIQTLATELDRALKAI